MSKVDGGAGAPVEAAYTGRDGGARTAIAAVAPRARAVRATACAGAGPLLTLMVERQKP
jgi:hypothetical protein